MIYHHFLEISRFFKFYFTLGVERSKLVFLWEIGSVSKLKGSSDRLELWSFSILVVDCLKSRKLMKNGWLSINTSSCMHHEKCMVESDRKLKIRDFEFSKNFPKPSKQKHSGGGYGFLVWVCSRLRGKSGHNSLTVFFTSLPNRP